MSRRGAATRRCHAAVAPPLSRHVAETNPPLARALQALRPSMEAAVVALAFCLFEMACGYECDEPRQSDYPPQCPAAVVQTLEAIWAPRDGAAPALTLDDVAQLPLFQRMAVRGGTEPPPLPPLQGVCAQLAAQQLAERQERHAQLTRVGGRGVANASRKVRGAASWETPSLLGPRPSGFSGIEGPLARV